MKLDRIAQQTKSLSMPSALAVLLLTGCVSGYTGPAPAVPTTLQPADGEKLALRLPATGVQIYECKQSEGKPLAWTFVAPEATLLDSSGAKVGTHFGGPTWELPDGSRVVGTVKQRSDAPVRGAIPWLLLSAKSTGGPGKLAPVTSIQRINTAGGVAPASGCEGPNDVSKQARVTYTADYYFYSAR